MTNLVSYEPFIEDCNRILIDRIYRAAESGVALDMGKWFQYYAFDVIGQITFSSRFGFMEQDSDVDGMIAAIDGVNRVSSIIGVFPSVYPYFMAFGTYFGLAPPGLIALESTIRRKIVSAQAVASSGDAPDFVQKMAKAMKEGKSGILDSDIRVAAMANVMAGSDTTSISLCAIIHCLIESPRTLNRLRVELEQAVRDGTVSDPISYRQAQGLPYLQAVIKEALRVHPATGFTMPRVVPVGGMELAGRHFPENVSVCISGNELRV
jgi:cytochrome P450